MSDTGYYDQSIPPDVLTPPVDPTAPTLTSLAPATGIVGQAVTVTLTGSGFIPASVVLADGSPLPTVYVSATQLTVSGTPLTTGTATLTVSNGSGLVSGGLPFAVTALAGTALVGKAKRQPVEWAGPDYVPPGETADEEDARLMAEAVTEAESDDDT